MPNQDQKTIKSKAFAISSIMKHPKLSKLIDDAWNSPAGSTKNNVARSVLKSVHKANSNYYNVMDGQGGGVGDWLGKNLIDPIKGLMNTAGNNIAARNEANKQTGYQFIKSIDDIINAPKNNPQMLGSSRLGEAVTGGLASVNQGIQDLGKAEGNAINQVVQLPGKVGPAISKVIWPWAKYAEEGVSYWTDPSKPPAPTIPGATTPAAPTATPGQKPYIRNPNSNDVYDRAGNHITSDQAAKIPGFWNQVEIDQAAPNTKLGESTPVASSGGKWSFVQGRMVNLETGEQREATPEEYQKASGQKGTTTGAQGISNGPASTAPKPNLADPTFGTMKWWQQFSPEAADAIFNNLDPSLKDFTKIAYTASKAGRTSTPGGFGSQAGSSLGGMPPASEGSIQSDVQGAYASNMGAEAFAMSELMDKKALGKKLGMSEEAASALPEGLLSTNINNLEDAINKEYRIEEQLNNLLTKTSQKAMVEQDFTDYIKGKDEYLGTIDKLLENADTQIANMDTSNPYVAQRVKNYTNYLTILKGRQNKRYIDFLKMATTQWNAELDQDKAIFDTSLAAAEKKLKREGAVTTETYNTVKTMLKDLYDNIEKREDRQMKIEKFDVDMLKSQADLSLDVLKYNNGGIESTQTERDRVMNKAALQKYIPTQDADGYMDPTSYLNERTKFAVETGDATVFDEAYSSYLTPQDRATLGVGKAVGEKASPEPLVTDYVAIAEEYKNKGYTREEAEQDMNDQWEIIPKGAKRALDEIYGEKSSWFDGVKKWIRF